MLTDFSFPKALGACHQPGVLHRLDGAWEGVRTSYSGAPGACELVLPRGRRLSAAACPGQVAGARESPAASAPFPPPPRPPPPTRCRLSCGFPPFPAARSPESNYFSLRSFVHPPCPRGRSGGRAAAHFPPPEAEARPLGRGERGLGGARIAADGTICPSACGPAGPRREAPGAAAGTPASSRMSGRRLAPGLPRAGAARGTRARALPGPRPEVTACPVAFSWAQHSRAPVFSSVK